MPEHGVGGLEVPLPRMEDEDEGGGGEDSEGPEGYVVCERMDGFQYMDARESNARRRAPGSSFCDLNPQSVEYRGPPTPASLADRQVFRDASLGWLFFQNAVRKTRESVSWNKKRG